MIRRIRAGALAGVLVTLILSPVSGAVESPWPDLRHGWAIRCSQDRPTPRCPYGLYSTEDGGRRWRLIFPNETGDFNGFLRTSTTAGVVSVDAKLPEQFWTRDNGGHWYKTRHLPDFQELDVDVAGRGSDLFWSRGRLLYEIINWVPQPGARLLPYLVHRVENGSFTDLEAVPRGVAAAIVRDRAVADVPLARLLVGRIADVQFVTLAEPDPAVADRVAHLEVFAEWPSLTVFGLDVRDGAPLVVWRCGAIGRVVVCGAPARR